MAKLAFGLLLALMACGAISQPATPFRSARIHVEVVGSGPDVVLIPGLGSSPRVWDHATAELPGYRYHLIHVAGFDGLPSGANANGPILKPVAEEIARYIAEKDLNAPSIVGHSLGGFWGMMITARHPRLVSRLMVVDMPPLVAPMIGGPSATSETVRPFAEQVRRQISAATEEPARRKIAEMVVGRTRTPGDRAIAISHWLASDPRVTGEGIYELLTTDLRSEISRMEVPVTVLWAPPEAGPLTEVQTKELYESSFAGARAVIKQIPDSHHLIMFDQPQLFAAELRLFLSGGER